MRRNSTNSDSHEVTCIVYVSRYMTHTHTYIEMYIYTYNIYQYIWKVSFNIIVICNLRIKLSFTIIIIIIDNFNTVYTNFNYCNSRHWSFTTNMTYKLCLNLKHRFKVLFTRHEYNRHRCLFISVNSFEKPING